MLVRQSRYRQAHYELHLAELDRELLMFAWSLVTSSVWWNIGRTKSNGRASTRSLSRLPRLGDVAPLRNMSDSTMSAGPSAASDESIQDGVSYAAQTFSQQRWKDEFVLERKLQWYVTQLVIMTGMLHHQAGRIALRLRFSCRRIVKRHIDLAVCRLDSARIVTSCSTGSGLVFYRTSEVRLPCYSVSGSTAGLCRLIRDDDRSSLKAWMERYLAISRSNLHNPGEIRWEGE